MKIAIFGDSISAEITMKVQTEAALQALGVPGEVALFAVPGEDTSAALKRLPELLAAQADYHYVFFGANDAADHRQVSPEDFQTNLTTFVTALGAEHTTIITPSYVNESAIAQTQQMTGRSNANVAKYVAAVKHVVAQTAAGSIDLNRAMVTYPDPDVLVVADGVHFTSEGYELVTSLIADDIAIRELSQAYD